MIKHSFFTINNSQCLWLMLAILIVNISPASALAPTALIGPKHHQVKLEVAQTQQEVERGLMYRTSLPKDAGMVFLFDPPRPLNFWMYHTLIPLDMLFIKDGKIVKIFEQVPPCKSENPHDCLTYPSGEGITVTEVVEVNGGWSKQNSIKEGDFVLFTLHPERTLSQKASP